MRTEAGCLQLKEVAATTLPAGHGCHELYHSFCSADFDQHFCPRVLGDERSRFGVATVRFLNEVLLCATRITSSVHLAVSIPACVRLEGNSQVSVLRLSLYLRDDQHDYALCILVSGTNGVAFIPKISPQVSYLG